MSFASLFKKLILFGIGIVIIILFNIYLNKISFLAQTKLNAKAKVDEVNLKKKINFLFGNTIS